MIDLDVFVLLRPLWLLTIPLVLTAAVIAMRKADGFGRWRKVIDPELLPALIRLGHVQLGASDTRPWVMAAAASLMAIGLAGPALRNPGAPIFRNLDAIVILLDLSPSMIDGGGLGDAQAAVARLLDRKGTRPVALAVYAGESFLVSVPTEDPQMLKSAIAVIDADTMPVAGSRPDRALQLAQQMLRDAQAENADVIVVSDGDGFGPDTLYEVDALFRQNVRISAVFVDHQTPPFGMPPATPQMFEAAVQAGGGILVNARDTRPLERLLADRRGLSTAEMARQAILFRDYGVWIFVLGMLALLPLFQQRRET
ncbi:hypothetical protein P775_12120 [Puniceibacterium antarcticum]|uniref:VWFA domain-containing protein n=1 Tax=Puniceibacterium antarcticum TaxID=1206336 RepID=A0A2G8REB5_9RHOB|nr:vWA domain-containing protein [Puniceibacterium antarcticum]PIL19924.1 hypothetical protein P775_12120 [Puniceibacterium antarcticum]